MHFPMTRHATTRMRQRAVPQAVLDLLLCYGASCRVANHARRFWFDRSARDEIRAGALDRTLPGDIARWFNTAAIVGDDGAVITVMRVSS